MRAQAIFHTAPKHVEIGDIELPLLADNHVLVATRCSAISPGTESLIYQGRMPHGLFQDKTIPSLKGAFEYPFRYGYSIVGCIVDRGRNVDPEWDGRRVFVFHPHQNRIVVALDECLPVPNELSSEAALFLPNMESALNFVMDANPIIGDIVGVFGLGVVGLLCTALLSRLALNQLIALDTLAYRRETALAMGATETLDPSHIEEWRNLTARISDKPEPKGLDIAFELSGNMDALNQAIEITGFAGKIIIGSWYGSASKPLDLGGHFHRNRIRLISSQVSTIDPQLSGRWSKNRRINLAWSMIEAIKPKTLISHKLPFTECVKAFQINDQKTEQVLQTIFEYPQ